MYFTSDRTFKLWDYRVSHEQMLLRSPRTPQIETNIDVVFWGVEWIELPTVLAGVGLMAPDADEAAAITRRHKGVEDGSLYCIASGGDRYFIAAQGFRVLQNVLDIFDSTLVNPAFDRPIEEYGVVLAHS
jgi:hypothetical protein